MRHGKIWIFLLTVLFLAAAVLSGIIESEGDLSISAVVRVGDTEEKISCWHSQEDGCYLILPGYAQLSQVTLRISGGRGVTLGEKELKDGMNCGIFSLDTPYLLQGMGAEDPHPDMVTFVRSGGVSTFFVDVASGSMEHIHEAKGNEEPGNLRLYSAQGIREYQGNFASLTGRGNSSWNMAKKSYNLELNAEIDLMGLGAAKKWVLQANAMDGSHLRNKIVYDFADRVGLKYSPQSQWADVYLNGEYAGLYLLCERNEVHPERVDISGAGSFLVAKDYEWRFRQDEKPYIMTEGNAALRIHYAELESNTLKELWQTAENAILAQDGVDPVTGEDWKNLIDLDSWVKKYLIEEVFGNRDGTSLSQFFYYDGSSESGKICAGPVWDYDLTMGNPIAVPEGGERMFFANMAGLYGSPWPAALYAKEEFYGALTAQYEESFRPALQELLDTGFSRYADRISAAAKMNSLRWGTEDAGLLTQQLQSYMSSRMAFLDDVWLSGKTYCVVRVKDFNDKQYDYVVEQGGCLPVLRTYENDEITTFYGWYVEQTGEPVNPDSPVWEDTTLVLRYEQSVPEPVPEEIPPEEPLALRRIAPLLLFGFLLIILVAAGLWPVYRYRSSGDLH